MSDAVAWLKPDWSAPARVRAAFTLRSGGLSADPYASLNLAAHVGDAPAAVIENRSLLRTALRLPAEPRWLAQVHGTQVLDADRDVEEVPTADAAITTRADVVLAVLVADCLPVLFARRDAGAVAIAHAGWRGLADGVLEATVAALRVPGEQLLAWVGPGIGPRHFEVGDEVRTAFLDAPLPADTGRESVAAAFVRNARGRWQCDLPRLAQLRLQALGIHAIHCAARCTYAEAQHWYSFRRDGSTGRMAGLIWLQA